MRPQLNSGTLGRRVTFVHNLQARQAWRRCRATLETWAPGLLARLPPGTTDDVIALVETAIGCPLPTTVACIYRIHNGFGVPAVLNNVSQDTPLLSLEDALAEHRFMCAVLLDQTLTLPRIEPSPGVRAAYWLRAWLPIGTFGNGDKFFLDLDPAPGGRSGHVVEWRHEDNSFPVRHDSLVSYLD